MKLVTMTVNYGGYVGTDEEIQFEVEDEATQDDIESAAEEEFKNTVLKNCGWEIDSVEDIGGKNENSY